jgi:hypothetical protein
MANNSQKGMSKLRDGDIHPGRGDVHPGQKAEKWKPEDFDSIPQPFANYKEQRAALTDSSACIIELDRRLKNVEGFLEMEFGDKYNK